MLNRLLESKVIMADRITRLFASLTLHCYDFAVTPNMGELPKVADASTVEQLHCSGAAFLQIMERTALERFTAYEQWAERSGLKEHNVPIRTM